MNFAQMSSQSSIWLITGATSGFGKRFAISALSRGDRVIATGRSVEKLQALVASVKPDYLECLRIEVLDVTSGEEQVKNAIDAASKHWGGIDVVVNNAGEFNFLSRVVVLLTSLISGAGFLGLTEEGGSKLLRRQFEINFFGVADVSTAALPYLRRSSNGRLVVIGSRSAWIPERTGLGPYAASKAAVNTMTENLMLELAPFNIKVLLVLPGAFNTEGIYSQKFFTENPIPAYDELREQTINRYASVPGSEPNDPDKAAEVVVDVVQSTGVAEGKPWPSYLLLGEDAEASVRGKCNKLLANLDEWIGVTRSVKLDERSLN